MYGFLKKFGIIRIMEISQVKIDAKLAELNAGLTPSPWSAMEEQSALMKTEFKDGKPVFYGSTAFIVKIFFNNITGELKFFPINMFKKDEE